MIDPSHHAVPGTKDFAMQPENREGSPVSKNYCNSSRTTFDTPVEAMKVTSGKSIDASNQITALAVKLDNIEHAILKLNSTIERIIPLLRLNDATMDQGSHLFELEAKAIKSIDSCNQLKNNDTLSKEALSTSCASWEKDPTDSSGHETSMNELNKSKQQHELKLNFQDANVLFKSSVKRINDDEDKIFLKQGLRNCLEEKAKNAMKNILLNTQRASECMTPTSSDSFKDQLAKDQKRIGYNPLFDN